MKNTLQMAELKPCPFCGGDAEMYTGRTYPEKGKGLCESYAQALEELEKWQKTGIVARHSIHQREHFVHGMKAPKRKWSVHVEMQAFIPRCCNPKCLGRTQMMFLTESEATEAWNKRMANNPCDLCRFNPPSSMDGKPCTICVADGVT